MPRQPLVEVFGHKVDDASKEAKRHRDDRLCPFGNKVPNCTKDKVENPLGVCSIYEGTTPTIVCPVRFRERWLIASDAADFFFPANTKWTSLTEVRLKDSTGKSAGNIDVVLVSYDNDGHLLEFGSLEIQGVYISGNLRRPFEEYMKNPAKNFSMDWSKEKNYPGADYLSSSRKRLAPQLIYKGGILHSWKKKMAVAIDKCFLKELPTLPSVREKDADLVWLVYELATVKGQSRLELKCSEKIYTKFGPVLDKITKALPGRESDFRKLLQRKLDEKLSGKSLDAKEAVDITEILENNTEN